MGGIQTIPNDRFLAFRLLNHHSPILRIIAAPELPQRLRLHRPQVLVRTCRQGGAPKWVLHSRQQDVMGTSAEQRAYSKASSKASQKSRKVRRSVHL
jgi:hypothetical protein